MAIHDFIRRDLNKAVLPTSAEYYKYLDGVAHLRDITPQMDSLREFIKLFRYKPGWKFSIRESPYWPSDPTLALFVSAKVPDATVDPAVLEQAQPHYDPNYLIPLINVAGHWPIPDPPYSTLDEWQSWLYGIICEIEMHELGEWFRVGYDRPYDPHKAIIDPPIPPEFFQ